MIKELLLQLIKEKLDGMCISQSSNSRDFSTLYNVSTKWTSGGHLVIELESTASDRKIHEEYVVTLD